MAGKRTDTCTKEEMCDSYVAREEILPSGIPLGDSLEGFYFFQCYRGILVRLVMCVMVGHRKLKIEIIKLLTILC